MRTNIEIDDKLMQDALEATGLPTKKAAVDAALRLLIQMDAQIKLRDMGGKVSFWDDYSKSRDDQLTDWDLDDDE